LPPSKAIKIKMAPNTNAAMAMLSGMGLCVVIDD
jgi:hypothetical protein